LIKCIEQLKYLILLIFEKGWVVKWLECKTY
jgi:hypothetical protein